jgi:superfamily II DNA/RNA helicase
MNLEEQFEKEVRRLFKSGKSLVAKAEMEGHFGLIQQLILDEIPEPKEGSPRGIILFPNDQMAREFDAYIENAFKQADLTSDLIIEKGMRIKQRNDLYFGTELIIGTPRRLCELYYQNGFNIGELKFCMVMDINSIFKKGLRGYVSRVFESLPKCKKLIFESHGKEDHVKSFYSEFMSPFKRMAENKPE